MTFAAVICDADDPCSVNREPESSFTISPQSTTRPLYYWCFFCSSINDAKCTVTSKIPSSKFSEVSVILCPLLLQLHVSNCSVAVNFFFFPAMWSSWIFSTVPTIRSLLNSSVLPLMHVIFDLGSSFLQRAGVRACYLSFLQGTAGSCWDFQLLPCILKDFLEFDILRINEVTSSQSSCIIELRFFHLSQFCFFLRFWVLRTYFSRFLATKWSGLDVILPFR